MIVHDLAGRWPKRHRILGVDPALDGVTVEFHVALVQRQIAAGSDPNLLCDQVDVGDHLGDRVFDLNARVHLDEAELAVLVEEFDRAGAQIFDLAHRLGDGLADLVAGGDIERRRGAFLPDFLMAPLQRAIAFAEMNGAAFAVAENLNFDVARLFEVFFQVKRVVAEGGFGFRARHGERRAKLAFAAHHFHAAAAAAGSRLEYDREAYVTGEPRRLFVGSRRRHRSPAQSGCRARRRRAWRRSCRP